MEETLLRRSQQTSPIGTVAWPSKEESGRNPRVHVEVAGEGTWLQGHGSKTGRGGVFPGCRLLPCFVYQSTSGSGHFAVSVRSI